MASKEWLDEDKYFDFADEYLLKHKKSPNAKVMHEFCGAGSQSTHQKLIEKWKRTQHVALIELPEKAETLIVKKAKELFAEGWKALEEANRDEKLKVQQEASDAIQVVQDSLNQTQAEKEEVVRRLEELCEKFELANTHNQSLLEKMNESEKLRFAAEEARRILIDNFNEFRENSMREKEELEKLYSMQIEELRNQISTNEHKFQEELVRREELWASYKKDYENRLATQEIIKEEMGSKLTQATTEIVFYQSKYEQVLRDLEARNEEILTLKNEHQRLSHLLEENKTLRVKQVGQVEQLEKQLNESREKNASLEYALRIQNTRVRELEENLNLLAVKTPHYSSEEPV